MLQKLSIQNYTLIKKLEISFSSGFTVITGETGAGKSILLGALSLILGKRADTQVLLDDKKKCIVEGLFDISDLSLETVFEQYDLDYDDHTYLRREIVPSGKSRAFINDTPVKLEVIKTIGNVLVDIHSQHQGLALSRPAFQLEVLDGFVNNTKLIKDYKSLFSNYSYSKKQLRDLELSHEQAKRDEAYFQFQYDELEAAALDADMVRELESQERLLSHAEEVLQGLSQGRQIFTDADDTVSAQLESLKSSLQKIEDYLPALKEVVNRLDSVGIEVDDIAAEMEIMAGDISYSPEEFQEVSQRLNEVYKLQHKHSVTSVEDLIGLKDEYAMKLQGFSSSETQIQALKTKIVALEKQLDKSAAILSKSRYNHQPLFENAVKDLLLLLGMKDASFELQFSRLNEFGPMGNEEVSFLFSANKGVKAAEMSRVASGGELSRLMLAIKSLISGKQMLPTVVFDEIDAGVSGKIAGKMARVIQSLSQNHQVISISHLPQIAAKADHHFKVYKEADEQQSHTSMLALSMEERINELAEMLSDEVLSSSALAAAKELLKY